MNKQVFVAFKQTCCPLLANIGNGVSYFACSRRSGIEDFGLHVRGQVGIDGKNKELRYLRTQSPTSLL